MATKKLCLAFTILLFLLSTASASNLFYNSFAVVELNKEEFTQGETIEAKIKVVNMEAVPIAEAYVVVELVQGGDYYYPSQARNADNIFFEEKITGLNIAANDNDETSFSYTIPILTIPGI